MGHFDDRLARLRRRMAETGTDLVAVGPSRHMVWLSGVDPHGDERPVMLLVSQGEAGFLMPQVNADAARQHTDLPFHTWSDAEGPGAALAGLLARLDAGRPGLSVALDETMRADFAFLLLDALDQPRRRFLHDTVGALRAVKDAHEIDALRASARLNDAAVEAAIAALTPGMTERDVQAALADHYAAHGARPEFCIVGFGPNGAFPHHHTGDTVLREDTAVLIDTGCRLSGYPSDMTRSFWFGTAPAEYRAVRDVVEQAVEAALAAARPGVPAQDVDRAARGVIEAAGYGAQFVHRTGHGVGLDVHEAPNISVADTEPLEEGHVFSIEPGIYLPGRFGVRLEEVVYLRADGPEILSAFPRMINAP
jgi:Xaa-Pro aminopeptidase